MRMRTLWLLAVMSCAGSGAGCATHHAYDGPHRPADMTATLSIVGKAVRIDDQPVPSGTRTIVVPPGPHVVAWTFSYPNGFAEDQVLSFTAAADHRYHLGDRFFAAPSDLGPLGDMAGTALDIAFLPLRLVGGSPEADTAPPGRYLAWIRDASSGDIVAGEAPDVPLVHAPITFVPVE